MEKPHVDTTVVEVPADLASPALYRIDAAHHPRVDRAEMLRYLGYGGQQIEPELSRRIELVVERLELDIEPRGVRRVFAIDATGVDEQGEPCIRLVGTNVELRGRDIYRHLKDARFAALMACTLGMDAERRLRTTGAQQPLEGAVLDAACSAYVEAAVEQMDQQVKAAALPRTRGRWRFSPAATARLRHSSIVDALNATRLIEFTVAHQPAHAHQERDRGDRSVRRRGPRRPEPPHLQYLPYARALPFPRRPHHLLFAF
ncbi:MAG: hypothetical protein ACLUQW_02535 [Collinsella sp.]